MAEFVEKVELSFLSTRRQSLGRLTIASPVPASAGAIQVLSPYEAVSWSEHPVQLLEGVSYDYEVFLPAPNWRLRPGAARRSALATSSIERGRIVPGLYTGSLRLVLENAVGDAVADVFLEVRSTKLGYRNHYRAMLNDIARRTIDLVLDIRSQAASRVAPDRRRSARSAAQQFMFVRHLLSQGDFAAAIARISANPNETTVVEVTTAPISRGLKVAQGLGRHLASANPRSRLTPSHPLSLRFASLPITVPSARSLPSLDTSENRFVKHVLKTFERQLAEIASALRTAEDSYRRIRLEAVDLQQSVSALLNEPFLEEVGEMVTRVPYGSSVLQRRGGYREILHIWTRYVAATALDWETADELFAYGSKDVATLYEYWIFFELLDVVRAIFKMTSNSLQDLFQYDRHRLVLRLRSGRHLAIHGSTVVREHSLQVRFSYNRTFARRPTPRGDPERSWPSAGSWTRAMRPDYTLTLWPVDLSESEAELADRIAHLHFDAKYRVEGLQQLFGDDLDSIDPDAELAAAQVLDAQREDLLKMHAYRDAIRRSVSAFVLYPGDMNRRWRAYETILPGLGAIAMTPGDFRGRETVKEFMLAAVEHVALTL